MNTPVVTRQRFAEPSADPQLSSPVVFAAFRWLIHDTFRQALASRIFWVMLLVSGACIVFCLGVTVESALAPKLAHDTELYTPDHQPYVGGKTKAGSITLLYGFIRIDHNRHAEDGVRFLQVVLAGVVAGVLGFVLALVWTAGFVPDFLQPAAASVLLAKPVPRGVLLAGKYLGVVAFVGFQIFVFFGGTWLALALRTGVWDGAYLAAIPLFLLQFAVVFSFTVFLAVLTRSTVACIFGSVLFWLLCWGMNVGRHFMVGFDQLTAGNARLGVLSHTLVELAYWVLPKPADIMMLLEDTLGASSHAVTLSAQPEMQATFASRQYIPELSVLASVAFAITILFIAARKLAQTDY